MMLPPSLRLPAVLLAASIVVAYALAALWPIRYTASARVMLPESGVMKIEQEADSPQLAARSVSAQLAIYMDRKAEVLDALVVRPLRPDLAASLALGAAAGFALGAVVWLARSRRRRPLRSEGDYLDALGQPLLAARPMRRESMRELSLQLLEHWFAPDRQLLAIVGANPTEGRSRFTAQLALAFAQLGHKTLVIDGDFRAPALHRVFGLPNRHGLADFLQDRQVSLASAGDNLTVMVAGSPKEDPLELLSRSRLTALLGEARRHFRVVLIDTPAAARGPDFQMFAALAGGALVVTDRVRGDRAALKVLRAALKRCSARLVTTVIHQD